MSRKQILVLFFALIPFAQEYFAQNYEINTSHFVAFKSDNKWGFKKNKEIAIPAKFDYVTHFSENFALVKSNGKWGYIDTLGNWFIEAQFDKAQPIQDHLAFVEKEGKTGLINLFGEEKEHTDLDGGTYYQLENIQWKYLIEAKYDNIKEDYNAYYLLNGKKKGFMNKNAMDYPAIPALYDSITYYTSRIVSGMKVDKKWDIYYDGKLVLENTDTDVNQQNFYSPTQMSSIPVDGEFGLFAFKTKSWVVKPQHVRIEMTEFPYYMLDGTETSIIYVAHEKMPMPEGAMLTEDYALSDAYYNYISTQDTITLYKANGEKITSKPYEDFYSGYETYSELQNPYPFTLYSGEKITILDKDFNLRETKYAGIQAHYYYNYFIADGKDMDYILDGKLQVIDSFPVIEKYKELVQSGDYNEYGEIIDPITGDVYYEPVFKEVSIEEPILVVNRTNGKGENERAIYQLEDRKIITPWVLDASEGISQITVQRLGFMNEVLYVYDFDSKEGFYLKGMDKGTDLKYFSQTFVPNVQNCFLMVSAGENDTYKYDLYALKDGKVTLISDKNEVFMSSDVYDYSGGGYDYETETYVESSAKAFSSIFFILKRNGKYGLIDHSGNIFEPAYDSLIQGTNSENFITTVGHDSLGNVFYGNIDLSTGKEIKPVSLYPLEFLSDIEVYNTNFYYSSYFDTKQAYQKENESNEYYYYISLDGKSFKSKPDLLFPKEVKGKYGLYGYSAFSDNPLKLFEQVKPQYKYLEQSFMPGVYRAQGKNKKWGFINFIGDTLVPLNYTAFDFSTFFGDNQDYITIYNKKKKGLFDLSDGELIPCIYDEIEILSDYEYKSVCKVKLNGKYGLVNLDGKQILGNNYDDIRLIYNDNFGYYVIADKGEKKIAFVDAYLNESKLVEFDFVAGSQGFIRTKDGFDVYSLMTNDKEMSVSLNDFKLEGTQFIIAVRNGKFGATDLQGNELVPFEYDYANFMEYRDEVMIGYQNGQKYFIYVERNERFTESQW